MTKIDKNNIKRMYNYSLSSIAAVLVLGARDSWQLIKFTSTTLTRQDTKNGNNKMESE